MKPSSPANTQRRRNGSKNWNQGTLALCRKTPRWKLNLAVEKRSSRDFLDRQNDRPHHHHSYFIKIIQLISYYNSFILQELFINILYILLISSNALNDLSIVQLWILEQAQEAERLILGNSCEGFKCQGNDQWITRRKTLCIYIRRLHQPK